MVEGERHDTYVSVYTTWCAMSRRYWLGTRYRDEPEPPVVAATSEQLASDELRRRDPEAWREGLRDGAPTCEHGCGAPVYAMRCCYEYVAYAVCAGRDDRLTLGLP